MIGWKVIGYHPLDPYLMSTTKEKKVVFAEKRSSGLAKTTFCAFVLTPNRDQKRRLWIMAK